MSGYPVVPPSEADALLVPTSIANLTTTRQRIGFEGAKWVSISYRLLPGATATAGQYAKLVINAASDADADGKLALTGGFIPVFQGDDILISAASITRLDVIAAQVVGSESTMLRVLAGV
jgi:hypothetical protein